MDQDLLPEEGVIPSAGEVKLGQLVPPEAMFFFIRLRTLFTAPPIAHVYSCSEMELLRILHVRPNQSHLYLYALSLFFSLFTGL